MTRINNEQTDLTRDEFYRLIKEKTIIENHRARESPKTKEMKRKYLK